MDEGIYIKGQSYELCRKPYNMTNQKGSTSSSKESKLMRYMKAPLRFLSKARDTYVHAMTQCSGHFAYADAAVGCPIGQISTLPRSFSAASLARSSASDDDFKELIRVASVRSTPGIPVDLDLRRKLPSPEMRVPRSRSVGIERIDEEKPCEFGDDDIKVQPLIYPRSKSYAVNGRGAGLF